MLRSGSWWIALPEELLIAVSGHYSAPSLLSLEATCRTWRDALKSDGGEALWKQLALARFRVLRGIVALVPDRSHDYRALYRKHAALSCPPAPLEPPNPSALEGYILTVQLFS